MTNNITEAAEHVATVAQLTILVDELRALRDRTAEQMGRQVTFAEVADTVAGTNPEAPLHEYLKELAVILDANAASEVDADLDTRWRDAVTPQQGPPSSGLPKLLS